MCRFYIRDLLWLTVVVGMGLGWWMNYQHMEARHAKRSEYIGKLKSELRSEIGMRVMLYQIVKPRGAMLNRRNC